LRLTAVFFALILLLLLGVSVVLYASLAQNLRNNVEGNFETDQAQNAFTERTVRQMRNELLLVDGVVLIVVTGAGFVVARRVLKPIRRNLESQKRFVSNVSHDLRTPLAVLRTDLELAARHTAQPGEHDAAVAGGLAEVERMDRMVADMLTLSRIDARQEELRFSVVDLSLLLAGIVAKMQPLANAGGVTVALTSSGDLNVFCDADHLERAVVNVLRNAVQHSPPESTVEVRAERVGRRVEVAIADTGDGIAPADLPHVFERHYRGDSARVRERGGSGLGLAIAQWIVRRHSGTITAASVVGKGTIPRVEHVNATEAHLPQKESAEGLEIGAVTEAPGGDRNHFAIWG